MTPDGPNFDYITNLLEETSTIFNWIMVLLVSFAVIYFIWNMVWYVVSANDQAKQEAKQRMFYGIVGLVIIFGIWAIVQIIVTLFGIDNSAAIPNIPQLPDFQNGIGPS